VFLLDLCPALDSRRPALCDGSTGRVWSYAEVADAVARLAGCWPRAGKGLIFLFCRNDVPTILAYLSAIDSGHAVALLDEHLAAEFRARLVAQYEPDCLAASSPAALDFDHGGAYAVGGQTPLDLALLRRRSGSEAAVHPDLALLLSTSGSTGSPKFVRLTRENVEANARSIREALSIDEGERPITSLPLHYSYGLSVLNSHLAGGAEVVVNDQGLTAPAFWQTFRDRKCTSWAGVPYSYQVLQRLDIDKLDVPSLQTLTQAGGRLHPDVIARFHAKIAARGGRMFVMYGQTEATARMSVLPPGELPTRLGSVGRAIPGGSITIGGDAGEVLPPLATGEVMYAGPNVMLGYAASRGDLALGDAQGGRLATGDAGYLDRDGFLFITGRLKRDAKVFGLRLNLDDIEDLLKVHGPTAAVKADEKIVLYCEHGDADAFRQYARDLSAKLRLHAGAFEFRRIERLPLNANGKVDYSALERSPR
jgi:acyl-CoA synthetase (AMP-forming)/AMP-acid ligase II